MSAYNDLFDACEARGFEMQIDYSDGLIYLVITHKDTGPIVKWAAFNGSIEDTARYAITGLH